MEILVFKTNVTSKGGVSKVQPGLNSIPSIIEWNFDFDDDDHILRVVSAGVSPGSVESVMKSAGFKCSELED